MRRRLDVRREDGVAMAEFALIAPVFLLLVIGTSRSAASSSSGSTRTTWPTRPLAGRRSIRTRTTTLQRNAIGGSTREFQSDSKVCIDFPPPTGAGPENSFNSVAVGDPIRVRVHKPFTIFGGWTIMIRGSSTMRVERFGPPPSSNPTAYTVAADPLTGNIGDWGAVGANDCIVP